MSIFHCPIGAPYYEGNGCVRCGLCIASTKEEYKAASEKIRAHIRSTSADRVRQYLIQKIAVSGKGGTGKSLTVQGMAKTLIELGYKVLVIDTDESNRGLGRKLGFDSGPVPLIATVGSAFSDYKAVPSEWLEAEKIGFADIPGDFVLKKGNLRFMMSGKILNPFQGCACRMADIVKDLLLKLDLLDKEIVIVDNEAGVESFGRGLERGADTIIQMVEPSFDSLEVAESIKYMAEGLGIGRVRAILNKIPSRDMEKMVTNELIHRKIRFLGTIFYDQEMPQAELAGGPAPPGIMETIGTLTRLMLDEAEMEYPL